MLIRRFAARKRRKRHHDVGPSRPDAAATSRPSRHFTLRLLEYGRRLSLLVSYVHWRLLRILVEDDGAEENCMYIGGGALLVIIVILLVYFL